LRRGDAVVFRTDGIVDARSPSGEFFGDERLASLVADVYPGGSTPAEVLRQALHAVTAHQAGRASDDATLLLLRWADDTGTLAEGARSVVPADA